MELSLTYVQYFSVKLSDNMNASSFKKAQKFFIDPYKLLPLSRFVGEGARGGGRGGRGRGGMCNLSDLLRMFPGLPLILAAESRIFSFNLSLS